MSTTTAIAYSRPAGGTAVAAELCIALAVMVVLTPLELAEQSARAAGRPSNIASSIAILPPAASDKVTVSKTAILPEQSLELIISSSRLTTPQEKIAGELRRWAELGANWDGEGAALPSRSSIELAVRFVRALEPNMPMPEPMLNGNGRAGLFWSGEALYADLEFIEENNRIAYFIKSEDNRHKGVVRFASEVPAVFRGTFLAG